MRRTKLISILFMPAALLTTRALTQGPPGPPPPPAGNPTTPDKVLLGKTLFFEEQLSSTRAVSCATCHVLERGGGDPRTFQSPSPGHDGIFGTPDDGRGSPGVVRQDADGTYLDSGSDPFEVQVTGRKAQPVVDAAFSRLQFWDGRSGPDFVDPVSGAVLLRNTAGLEAQAAGPPVSDIEMAHFGETWPNIATRITAARPLALATDLPAPLEAFVGDGATSYPDLFDRVFGSREVTPARIIMAIAAYERTLISANAPIDRFLAGDTDALTPQERRGFNTFNAARCDRCHAPPLFAVPDRFHFIGVRPPFEDPGRFAITGNPADRGAFKIPSLRNVERRAPYLHNGSRARSPGLSTSTTAVATSEPRTQTTAAVAGPTRRSSGFPRAAADRPTGRRRDSSVRPPHPVERERWTSCSPFRAGVGSGAPDDPRASTAGQLRLLARRLGRALGRAARRIRSALRRPRAGVDPAPRGHDLDERRDFYASTTSSNHRERRLGDGSATAPQRPEPERSRPGRHRPCFSRTEAPG